MIPARPRLRQLASRSRPMPSTAWPLTTPASTAPRSRWAACPCSAASPCPSVVTSSCAAPIQERHDPGVVPARRPAPAHALDRVAFANPGFNGTRKRWAGLSVFRRASFRVGGDVVPRGRHARSGMIRRAPAAPARRPAPAHTLGRVTTDDPGFDGTRKPLGGPARVPPRLPTRRWSRHPARPPRPQMA